MLSFGPPLPTRLFSLVYLEDGTDCAHFRSVADALGWAKRQAGRHWQRTLMLWDNIKEEAVNV